MSSLVSASRCVWVAGAQAGAVEIVACLLGSGTDAVVWALPVRLITAARGATAASTFVADAPRGAMKRLRLIASANARFDHADEIWLLGEADRQLAAALRNVLCTCDLNVVRLPADTMPDEVTT